ncbi:hypothetical protein D1614_24110 [Maribellus luteus]|uniref:Uncharacterized protein n=1 Tax=Maribellus luteus TaxID=2305463 RepID=A0A399SNP5_9BACT|nr:hypothetical protein D1614_24110 [Maribellus luteus]
MMRFWNYGFQFLEGRAVPFRARSEGTANERRSRSRLRTTDRVYSAVSGEERLNVAFSLIAASGVVANIIPAGTAARSFDVFAFHSSRRWSGRAFARSAGPWRGDRRL